MIIKRMTRQCVYSCTCPSCTMFINFPIQTGLQLQLQYFDVQFDGPTSDLNTVNSHSDPNELNLAV